MMEAEKMLAGARLRRDGWHARPEAGQPSAGSLAS
jgi:hypothetical protein